MKKYRSQCFAVVMFLLITCVGESAQSPTSTNQITQPPAFSINVIVTDRSNHSLDTINGDQIQVVEDKVPQTVLKLAKDDRPISYAIAIDASGSFKNLLKPSLDAARTIVNSNRAEDETLLAKFVSSDKIYVMQTFTTDRPKLIETLNLYFVEGGQSAVIDAVYLAVTAVAQRNSTDPTARRAVVLISDGEDRNSFYKQDDLIKLLRGTNIQLFVIGIVLQLDNTGGFVRPSPRDTAKKFLTRLAEETGGRVFFPKNVDELMVAAGEVSHDLRSQMVISYQTANITGKRKSRKVEVTLADAPGREKLTAITRREYPLNPETSRPQIDSKKKP